MSQINMFDNPVIDFDNVNKYIGIDPGSNGGIAIIDEGIVKVRKMLKFIDLVYFFREFEPSETFVILEKVSTWRNDEDTPGKAMNIVKMVQGYQQIIDALTITGLHYMEENGYSWQKKLRVWKKGEDSGERKNRYKEIARKIFSKKNIQVTLWNADALLLVNYCHMLVNYEQVELKKKYYRKYLKK